MARRFWLAGLAALFVVALIAPPEASAEIIRLRNGRILQGEIDPERTTDDSFAVTLYRDGASLRVLWDHVLGRDAKRLREAMGLDVLEGDTLLVSAHELMMFNGGSLRGLIIPNPGDPANYYLKTASGGAAAQAVPKNTIAKVLEIQLPLLEIYTVREAYEKQVEIVRGGRAEDVELSAAEHAAIADYCYRLGAYALSKVHYERVLEDETYPDKTRILNKLKNLKILVQAEEAGKLFQEIKRLRFIKRFKEALEVVAEFRGQYGHLTQVIAIYRLDTIEKRLRVSLKQQRIDKVQASWFRYQTRLISDKVRDKELSLKEAQAYAQKDLSNEILKEIAEKMELKPEEVQQLWKDRRAKPHTATYGYGSFAAPEEVAKAKDRSKEARKRMTPEEIRQRQREAIARRRNQQNRKEEKPKTAQEWWDKANSTSRKNWTTAYFVEHGGAEFEITRIFHVPCKQCAGKGYKIANVAQGDSGQEKLRCITCNGHGLVRMIRYK